MVADSKITIVGDKEQTGAYVLRLRVGEALRLAFGRFKQGKIITIPAGECLYVGSAMGRPNGAPLARRLLRHATRSGERPSHPIRAQMLVRFSAVGLGVANLKPPQGKKLFWNVDYLLDQNAVDLAHVFILRSPIRLETALSRLLARDRHTYLLEKGLGANDAPGDTHLLGVDAGETWWQSLSFQFSSLLGEMAA